MPMVICRSSPGRGAAAETDRSHRSHPGFFQLPEHQQHCHGICEAGIPPRSSAHGPHRCSNAVQYRDRHPPGKAPSSLHWYANTDLNKAHSILSSKTRNWALHPDILLPFDGLAVSQTLDNLFSQPPSLQGLKSKITTLFP